MKKTDYKKAQDADSKGLPVHDWRPGRITEKYRKGWDQTFKKTNLRADKKLDK